MIEEIKYCSDVMKKYFNTELVMTKKENEVLKTLQNVESVRDHYHITGKFRGSAHRYCNINLKLNHKIPVLFFNLKNYDSHLIMQELAKFNLKKKRYTE